MILDDYFTNNIIKDLSSNIYLDKYDTTFSSFNISIIKYNLYGGEYVCIIRFHSYKDNNFNISINQCLILDKDFNIIKKKFYYEDFPKSDKIIGLEDVRLILYNNKLFYTGNKKIGELNHSNTPSGTNTRIGCQISEFVFDSDKLLDNTFITPTFIEQPDTDKNWAFFTMNDEPYFIYSWFPIRITQLNGNKLDLFKEVNVPEEFKDLRGSTNGVIINDEIWFLVHIKKTQILYYHLFVIFDLNMNVLRYSNEFQFKKSNIEFCLSMIKVDDDLIISYNYENKYVYLKKYNINKLNNLLEWTYPNANIKLLKEKFSNNSNFNINILLIIFLLILLFPFAMRIRKLS